LALIGTGGVFSGAEAYAKLRAGASLVQIYTALIYEGPGLLRRIKSELARRLAEDGVTSVAEAVGRAREVSSTAAAAPY
jgi:dihydroorotate dehydrogenase